MAPYTNIPLSPAELSYLHTSLAQNPPIRPDGRSPTQFRPLVAEIDILPSTNGSARICFADGTEAVVGVKAEVEKNEGDGEAVIEVGIEIPGMRDDDALPVFLGCMVKEAFEGSGMMREIPGINGRFRWRVWVDVLLLSQPLSYPLPLLSLTTHLALRTTRLPALKSQGDEDPLFDDDWEASIPIFPNQGGKKPPVTLLVMTIGENILFDPSKEELAVADSVVAVSVDGDLKLVALRTVDPPSRLTAAGVPNLAKGAGVSAAETLAEREKDVERMVWQPPKGGVSRTLMSRIIKAVVEKGGVGQEVMEGLESVQT